MLPWGSKNQQCPIYLTARITCITCNRVDCRIARTDDSSVSVHPSSVPEWPTGSSSLKGHKFHSFSFPILFEVPNYSPVACQSEPLSRSSDSVAKNNASVPSVRSVFSKLHLFPQKHCRSLSCSSPSSPHAQRQAVLAAPGCFSGLWTQLRQWDVEGTFARRRHVLEDQCGSLIMAI